METPPTRTKPDLLPVAAADLDFHWRAEVRLLLNLYRFVFAEARQALGYLGRQFAALARSAVDPATSRETLIGFIRAVARACVLYGCILVVVMPLAGGGEQAWRVVLTVTVVSMAVELSLGGGWFTTRKKVSLVKQPRP